MKSWLRSVSIAILLTILSLSLILSLLPTLLKPLLNNYLPGLLSPDEAAPAQFHISTFNWNRLSIDKLELPLPDGSLLALDKLTLNYSPRQLLHGQLKNLDIHSITLSLADQRGKQLAGVAAQGAKQAAKHTLSQKKPIAIPPFIQWLRLPLERISIASIQLQHPTFSAELQASVTPELWRLWGDLQINNAPLPWQLEAQLQSAGQLLVMLSEGSQLLTQLHADIKQDEQGQTHIKLQQQTQLDALIERLLLISDVNVPMNNPLQAAQLEAQVSLPAELHIPQDITLNSTLSISSEETELLNQHGQTIHWQQSKLELTLDKEQSDGWHVHLTGEHRLQAQIPVEGTASMLWQLHQPESKQSLLTGQCNAELSECELNSHLSLHASQSQGFDTQLALTSQASWQIEQGIKASSSLLMDAHQQATSKLPSAQLNTQGTFRFNTSNLGKWSIESKQGLTSKLVLGQITLPEATTEKPATAARRSKKSAKAELTPTHAQLSPIHFSLLSDLHIRQQQDKIQFSSLAIAIQAFQAKLLQKTSTSTHTIADLNVGNSQVNCVPQLQTSSIEAKCQLAVKLEPSNWQQWPIPDLTVSGPLHVSQTSTDTSQQQTLTGDMMVSLAQGAVTLRSRLSHRMQQEKGQISQQGSAQLHLADMPTNWDSLHLSNMTNLTKVQLLSGSLSAQGWLDWQQAPNQNWKIKPDIMLRADNVSMTYDNSVTLENWSSMFALRRPLDFNSQQPGDYLVDAQISGDTLNPGIELSSILARSQVRIPADMSYALINMYELNIDALGGRIYAPNIQFDTRKETNAFNIQVDHLQVAELAKLEPNAEVEATGTLDGSLPIVLTKEGPGVPAGQLLARDPGGVVRYNNETSQALKQSDQTVGLAMQLLENFQYNQLESNIQYQPDGKLNLGLQFQGHNPDFFDGQATHLNVNLDYNLLDLLESLRITQGVIQKVEEKYK